MKVVIAIDSFKESLTSLEAGNAAREGILRVFPDAEVKVCPLADGGEGTTEALVSGMGGEMVSVIVEDPLGKPVEAKYGILSENGQKTAIIEMAASSGLALVPVELRDPMNTSTYGVGQMIANAIGKGCRRFLVGIGGSATNDGGAGMLQALGFSLTDELGKPIERGAKGLKNLASVSDECALRKLQDCVFHVACDVNNPLCGERGASAVFGTQKGATRETIPLMDGWLKRFAELSKAVSPDADAEFPGTGAAGGLGFAFKTFLHAELRSGVSIVLEETHLKDEMEGADFVVTGEGRLDGQTAMGKAPIGVAKLGKECGAKVLAFSGCVTKDARLCNEHGIDAFFPILRTVCTLEEAMNAENAKENLADMAEQAFRLVKAMR